MHWFRTVMLVNAALVCPSSVISSSLPTAALSSTVDSTRGDCTFEEIQMASDGAIERRSMDMGARVTPNRTMNGTVEPGEIQYYHLCILRHEHEHQINVNLTTTSVDDGDANLFLSSLEKYPRMGHAAWLSQHIGHDFVKLYTYLDGFPRKNDVHNRSIALHIGVVGVEAPTQYNLTVSVLDLPITSDVLSREAYYTRLHRAQEKQRLRRQPAAP